MSNSDIELEQAKELLAGKTAEEQLPFLYAAITNQSKKCGNRQEKCSKKFVHRAWFRSKVAFVSGIVATISLFGVGTLLKLMGVL